MEAKRTGNRGNHARRVALTRRRFLASLGTGVAAPVAGCTGRERTCTPTARVATVIKERTVRVSDTQVAPSRTGGTSDSLLPNAMEYTGADDLIRKQAAMMDPAERIPIVKRILATIWNDAPTMVTTYPKDFQALNEAWDGWIVRPGGETAPFSLLNIRQANGAAGGRPVLGLDTPPDTLNVLATISGYSASILENIYTHGTAIDSRTFEFLPQGTSPGSSIPKTWAPRSRR